MICAKLDVPMPPSVNRLWRHGRGKTYRSAAYVSWLRSAGWELKAQKPPAVEGWCTIRLSAAIPARRRDLDNLIKALLNLLVEHRVIEDDADVAAIDARWDGTVPAGRVVLEVRSSIAPVEHIGAGAGKKTADATAKRFRPAA
jgi:crossover junction endodeoxyribonuclease RusA